MQGLGTGTVVVLVAATIGGLLVLRYVLKRETDKVIRRLIVVSLLAKLAGTAAYYLFVEEVWGGGDVKRYARAGRSLAPIIRSGTLPDEARETGTPFMEFLTGVVFAAFGPREIAGYVVFSLLAFVGMFLFLQAFRLAVPDGSHRRYAFLVLLMPTMLFWPSTIGKEAWLVFALGVGAYGAARVLRQKRLGYLVLAAGILGVLAVRPHMGALFAVCFTGAYLLRFRDRSLQRRPATWLVGLLIVSIGSGYALVRFSEEMGDEESQDAPLSERIRSDTDSVFERTDRNTRRGSGEFDSRPVRSPGDLVHAMVTVPFRPLLPEAHNRSAQLSSVESLFLMLLILVSVPRFVGLPRRLLRQPYVAMAAAYSLGFIIAFSNVGNFGILVRQRAQLLPFLVVLLALPVVGQAAGPNRAGSGSAAVPLLVPVSPADARDEQNRPPGAAPSPGRDVDVDRTRGPVA